MNTGEGSSTSGRSTPDWLVHPPTTDPTQGEMRRGFRPQDQVDSDNSAAVAHHLFRLYFQSRGPQRDQLERVLLHTLSATQIVRAAIAEYRQWGNRDRLDSAAGLLDVDDLATRRALVSLVFEDSPEVEAFLSLLDLLLAHDKWRTTVLRRLAQSRHDCVRLAIIPYLESDHRDFLERLALDPVDDIAETARGRLDAMDL